MRLDVWLYPLAGGGPPRPLVTTAANDVAAAIAPDGRMVAYTSNESGRQEVYVRAVEGSGGGWQVSSGGGQDARWRGDGGELYYLTSQSMMAVTVTPGATPSFGAPRQLFAVRIPGEVRSPSGFDVTADGNRFLLVAPVYPTVDEPQLELLSDWRARLASSQ